MNGWNGAGRAVLAGAAVLVLAGCGAAPAQGGSAQGGSAQGGTAPSAGLLEALSAAPNEPGIQMLVWEDSRAVREFAQQEPVTLAGVRGIGVNGLSQPFPLPFEVDEVEMALEVHPRGPREVLVWGVENGLPSDDELRALGYEQHDTTWAQSRLDLRDPRLPWFRPPDAPGGPTAFGLTLPAPVVDRDPGLSIVADAYGALARCLGDPIAATLVDDEGMHLAAGVLADPVREVVCGPGGADPAALAERIEADLARNGPGAGALSGASAAPTDDGLVRIELPPPGDRSAGAAMNGLVTREIGALFRG
ncbi:MULTISPECIES: hypothetical protein [Pseudonocardia]|uniref:Lipoprotein LpqB n=2 Tax=Pseudonocardia TaxID=1847 RepID=A0A1Y2MV86_PSEAH|nr:MULTISPECIES: hypothetical protein [Pseudonocardia]OSY39102.1 hypothetical protein BG845_03672 [Pseudonocardia autotrophica]TDN71301.1 hypothetical protein C8E95_0330 [Pseudonocardia autotrophica]BBG01975.1 hypothetical protein Pdca_31840 [Pseudonocardia autotrophica]GEC23139.1 hypothetical protein PSA01_01680 [Pseudonocardia saturnea]